MHEDELVVLGAARLQPRRQVSRPAPQVWIERSEQLDGGVRRCTGDASNGAGRPVLVQAGEGAADGRQRVGWSRPAART